MADLMTYGQQQPYQQYPQQPQQSPQQQQGAGKNILDYLTGNGPNQGGLFALLNGLGMTGNQSAYKNIGNLSNQASNISSAMGNPNNPLYQQLYGQYKQQNMNNLVGGLNAAAGQNRMLQGMGRTPLFAPGREGEEGFRQLMTGYQNNDLQAQQQVQGNLAQQMQGINSSAFLQNQALQAQKNQNAQNTGSLTSIANFLGKLF